jgi:hypothetical protein
MYSLETSVPLELTFSYNASVINFVSVHQVIYRLITFNKHCHIGDVSVSVLKVNLTQARA